MQTHNRPIPPTTRRKPPPLGPQRQSHLQNLPSHRTLPKPRTAMERSRCMGEYQRIRTETYTSSKPHPIPIPTHHIDGTLMTMPMRPCIECGQLSNTTRCKTCQQQLDRERNATRAHYKGDYRKRAAQIRANASTCWICGGGPSPTDPWQADHVNQGDPYSPLRAAHRSCNAARNTHTTPDDPRLKQ